MLREESLCISLVVSVLIHVTGVSGHGHVQSGRWHESTLFVFWNATWK
jgi:hypothetical protein